LIAEDVVCNRALRDCQLALVRRVEQITAFLDERKRVGDEVRVEVLRDGKPLAVTVRLGELPED
jgi:S1-C subfamily serine protease